MNKKIIYLLLMLACSTAFATVIDFGMDTPISNDYLYVAGTPSLGSFLIDAVDEKVAAVFPVNGSWTFRKFGFVTGTVTTGATIDVRIETVQEKTPGVVPTGTLYCANSSTTLVLANADDSRYMETADLPSDCTVTNSTVAVVVLRRGAFAGNVTSYSVGRADNIVALSSVSTNGYTVSTALLNFVAFDSSSTIIPIVGNVCISTLSVVSISSSSTPNTYGNKITLPFAHRVTGAIYNFGITNKAKITLWDSDGSTALETVEISSALYKSLFKGVVRFSSKYSFAANESYRISITPLTTGNISMVRYLYNTAAIKNYSNQFGQYIDGGSATNPTSDGDWTENSLSVIRVFPLIDQIDTGSAGSTTAIGVIGN